MEWHFRLVSFVWTLPLDIVQSWRIVSNQTDQHFVFTGMQIYLISSTTILYVTQSLIVPSNLTLFGIICVECDVDYNIIWACVYLLVMTTYMIAQLYLLLVTAWLQSFVRMRSTEPRAPFTADLFIAWYGSSACPWTSTSSRRRHRNM